MLISFACSQQGTKHVDLGIPGQDFSMSKHVIRQEQEYVICAVADGVGSCEYSHYGSETAVTSAIDFIVSKIGDEMVPIEEPTIGDLLHEAFYIALDESTLGLKDKMNKPMGSFATTLTLAIFSQGTLWYGHCGDGGIIVLYSNGEYEMITKRHKGTEKSSVYPLSEVEEWEFGKTDKSVASLVMVTDGILDHYVPFFPTTQKLYFPAFRPVLLPRFDGIGEIPTEEQRAVAEIMEKEMRNSILQNTFPVLQKENVTDDLSYAAIIDYEATENVPNVVFDKEQWIEEVRAHNQKIRALLNQHNVSNAAGEDGAESNAESSEPNSGGTESQPEQSGGNQATATGETDARSLDPVDTRRTQDSESTMILEDAIKEESDHHESDDLSKDSSASSESDDLKAPTSPQISDKGSRREVGRQQGKKEHTIPNAKKMTQDPNPERSGRIDVERRRVDSTGKSTAAQQFEKGMQIFIDRVGRFIDDILYADDRGNGSHDNPDKKN